jgi:hypothetical protein
MQGVAARCWSAGQRFERCVCQAPCRIQVAAIKRDQRLAVSWIASA